MTQLDNNIKPYDVCVVGLGYVGLTLAVTLCDVGLRVLGIEYNEKVVKSLQQGIPHFSESGLSGSLQRVVKEGLLTVRNKFATTDFSNYFVITVGTPLNEAGTPRIDFIERATAQVAERIRPNDTVILRSTVAVGTTNQVVRHILDQTNVSFNLAMCPERTLEGNAMNELRQLPQIIGADDPKSTKLSEELFRLLTNVTVPVGSCEAAEVIKLADNTFRDVSFAFGNEVARVCEAVGISAYDVIRAGKLGYTRTNIALPGFVGGPCLEKDPHILMHSMKKFGLELEITRAARQVNERQPEEFVKQIRALALDKISLVNTNIVVAGIAFKGVPETDDIRGSMVLKLLEHLEAQFKNPNIKLYDPVINELILTNQFSNYEVYEKLEDAIVDADLMIIANNHPKFASVHPKDIKKKMRKNSLIFDVWNHFSGSEALKDMNYYFALGSINYAYNGRS